MSPLHPADKPLPRALASFYPDRVVDLLHFTPADVDFEAIAKRLARLPRFAGGTRETYSVAQHSVFVCDTVPREFRPWALLHDAHEAFITDIPTPTLRALVAIAEDIDGSGNTIRRGLLALKSGIDRAIFEAAGIGSPSDIARKEIAAADAHARRVEITAFLDLSPESFARIGEVPVEFPGCFAPLAWSAERAETEFLRALQQFGII